MKIALIRKKYSATGGAEMYLQRLMDALVKEGHEVHLYTGGWSGVQNPAIRIHAVESGGVSRARMPLHFAEQVKAMIEQETFDSVFSLERTLKQDVYRAGDGIHADWLEARSRFSPWWKKPFVGAGGFHRNMKTLEESVFNPANTGRIIVNSEMIGQAIVRRFRFPEARIHLIRNGVNRESIRSAKREEARIRFGYGPDDFVMVFVGSGWERKGLRFSFEAMKRLNDPAVKLLVVGKGNPPASRPCGVLFAGALDHLSDAYAAGDLFLFLPVYEPSANVCFEALVAGLPVVTTRSNGASEVLVEGKNGSILDDPSDTAKVVDAIRFWRTSGRGSGDAGIDLSMERNVMQTLDVLRMDRLE